MQVEFLALNALKEHPGYVSEDELAADSEKEREVIQRRKDGRQKGWLEVL
jgi:hypothetical protein